MTTKIRHILAPDEHDEQSFGNFDIETDGIRVRGLFTRDSRGHPAEMCLLLCNSTESRHEGDPRTGWEIRLTYPQGFLARIEGVLQRSLHHDTNDRNFRNFTLKDNDR